MGKLVEKKQCPECMDSGKDNLAVYEDGSTYCFGCTKMTKKATVITPTSFNPNLVPIGRYIDLEGRGIKADVCKQFDYSVGTYTGYLNNEQVRDEPVHIANIYKGGRVVGQKIRGSNKRFASKGEVSGTQLFGQQNYAPNKNVFVTITEGELDAMSVAQAQGKQWPVVSIVKGINSAKKELSENLEWLQGFKHVVLAFDNDDIGQKVAQDCVDLFEPGKVKIANWLDLKDANEFLTRGRKDEIRSILFNAKESRPDKLCSPLDLRDRILKRPTTGTEWPWRELTNATYGMRERQLIVVGAAPSIGKTELVKDIILHIAMVENMNVGIFSFEQAAEDTMRRLVGGLVNKPLHIPGAWWDEKVIEDKLKLLEGKVMAYDNWGGAKIEDLVPKMRYLAKANNTKLFVVDHLTAIAARIDGDERRGIEKAMEMFASLTQELNCTIILVSHLARDKQQSQNGEKNKSWGQGRRPVLENLKGSGAIEAWADVVLGLRRDADSPDPIEKRIMTVECLKVRLDGTKRGYEFNLIYNDQIGKLESANAEFKESD